MKATSLFQFLTNINSGKDSYFQNQSFFEFKYKCLFGNNSGGFLIEQLDFPKIESNIGHVFLDGFAIPVHSTPKFDNNIRFTMYVKDEDWKYNGVYSKIFRLLLADEHKFIDMNNDDGLMRAEIIPISSKYDAANENGIVLYNAIINSISLQGGFVSNSVALSKFDIAMSYSYFEVKYKYNF